MRDCPLGHARAARCQADQYRWCCACPRLRLPSHDAIGMNFMQVLSLELMSPGLELPRIGNPVNLPSPVVGVTWGSLGVATGHSKVCIILKACARSCASAADDCNASAFVTQSHAAHAAPVCSMASSQRRRRMAQSLSSTQRQSSTPKEALCPLSIPGNPARHPRSASPAVCSLAHGAMLPCSVFLT